jgi:hypothetical protein
VPRSAKTVPFMETLRLKEVLAKQGDSASRRRIGRIMQEARLVCKIRRRFKATTNAKHNLKTECVNHETLQPVKLPENPSLTTSKSSTTDNAFILTMATCPL